MKHGVKHSASASVLVAAKVAECTVGGARQLRSLIAGMQEEPRGSCPEGPCCFGRGTAWGELQGSKGVTQTQHCTGSAAHWDGGVHAGEPDQVVAGRLLLISEIGAQSMEP